MLFKLYFYVKLFMKTYFIKLLLTKSFDLLFQKGFPLSRYRLWISECWTYYCQAKSIFNHERKWFIKSIVMSYENLYFHVLYVLLSIYKKSFSNELHYNIKLFLSLRLPLTNILCFQVKGQLKLFQMGMVSVDITPPSRSRTGDLGGGVTI